MANKKHEWRKLEKEYYLPKNKPVIINVPTFKFITIEGEGSPQNESFSDCIGVLYSMAYAIKMNLKKSAPAVKDYIDFTVYPLEGIWDLNPEAKKKYDGALDKNDLVFKLMIRQPNFINASFFEEMLKLTKKKKPHTLLSRVGFESIEDGKCVQMLHVGSYDDEPASFKIMEAFTESQNLKRLSKSHREIYLSDFRKVPVQKLKTVLRFKVGSN